MQNIDHYYGLLVKLYPIPRSLTGEGVRQTLRCLGEEIPGFKIRSISSGTEVFDWVVPMEWVVRGARLADEYGNTVVDFKDHNLHLIGYSSAFSGKVSLEELRPHLHYLIEYPNAIPYVTSYYSRDWGFCLTYNQYKSLQCHFYHVNIDTEFRDGTLDFGEVFLPGPRGSKEIVFSSYICHPSMVNNELSGPILLVAIANYVSSLKDRKYGYRFIFAPETIGSIAYISRNIRALQRDVLAGFILTCIGDDGPYSYVEPRVPNLAEKALCRASNDNGVQLKRHSWLERGSDERQFCAPGIDLPFVTMCRSKFGTYPEYHTDRDNLSVVSRKSLADSIAWVQGLVQYFETNWLPEVTVSCEPNLGSRGMYPTLSKRGSAQSIKRLRNVLSYCDGRHDPREIAEKCEISIDEVSFLLDTLKEKGLVK
jgi:aminopeptidase-like protein